MSQNAAETVFQYALFVLNGGKTDQEIDLTRALHIGKSAGLTPHETLDLLQKRQVALSKLIGSSKNIETLVRVLKAIFETGPLSKEMLVRVFSLRELFQVSCEVFVDVTECVLHGKEFQGLLPAHAVQPLEATAAELTVENSVPASGFCAEFAETKSESFHKALLRAKKIGDVKNFKRDGRTWYSVSVPNERFQDFIPFADAAMGLKLSTLFVAGQEIEWRDVFRFRGCSMARKRAYSKVDYCFGKGDQDLNPWGCRWTAMFWHNGRISWLQFGRWETGGSRPIWIFDKAQIKEQLLQRIYQVRFCPHLNFHYIEAFLRVFPDRAEVIQGGDWDYAVVDDADPDGLQIRHTILIGKSKYTTDITVKGVKPTSQQLLMRLVEQAASEAGAEQPNLSRVLRKGDLPTITPFEAKALPETSGKISVDQFLNKPR